MTDTESTYAAIITLELPGMAQPATVTVILTPADAVATGGRVKPLADCTLADLQEFGAALEEEIWARYQAQQLIRLADDDESHVRITVTDGSGQQLGAPGEEWLQHAIILPPDKVEEDKQGGSTDTTPGDSTLGAAPVAEPTLAASESAEGDVPAAIDPTVSPLPETANKVEAEETDKETSHGVKDKGAPVPEPEIEEVAADPPVSAPAGETQLPVETPVVEGVEPTTAPVAAEEALAADIRILGLRRPIGHPTPAAVDILINESAFRAAQEHALTSLNREVAGMLIGPRPEKQPDGRYVVHISDTIIARHTRMAGASVTYTPESWRHVTDVLTERYPNEEAVIVGWYHTHPGFGIFLSGMDLFIHQNFFIQKWHVALVLDPRSRRSGFFCWDRQQTAVQPYDFPWPTWASDSW